MPSTAPTIKTVKSGHEYRAKTDSHSLLFQLANATDPALVVIYTPTQSLGLYRLDRFGGQLTPASIRAFLAGA